MSSTYLLAERNFRSAAHGGMPQTARAFNKLQRFFRNNTTRFGSVIVRPDEVVQLRADIAEARRGCSAEKELVLNSVKPGPVTGVPLVHMKDTGNSISGVEILEPAVIHSHPLMVPLRLLFDVGSSYTLKGFKKMIERVTTRIEQDLQEIERRLERSFTPPPQA